MMDHFINHSLTNNSVIRAFALGLLNAKCKENLAFQAQNCSAFGILYVHYKIWHFIPFLSHLPWLSHSLNFVPLVSLSFRFLPLPFLSLSDVCSDGFDVALMGLLRCGCGLLRSVYHGLGGGSTWWAVGYGIWVLDLGWSRCDGAGCWFGLIWAWIRDFGFRYCFWIWDRHDGAGCWFWVWDRHGSAEIGNHGGRQDLGRWSGHGKGRPRWWWERLVLAIGVLGWSDWSQWRQWWISRIKKKKGFVC